MRPEMTTEGEKKGGEIIEHSAPYRRSTYTREKLKMFLSNYLLYIIPKGAIKTQVKLSFKRYGALTQVKQRSGFF